MFSYMENLPPNEVENIRKTVQDLFKQTCILQVKYDPVTLIQRDNPRYQVCMRHREFISEYLEVMGCELLHDPQEHLFRITGDGILVEKLSLLQTRILLLLKLIYRDKIMGEGLQATITNLAEIRMYGKDTNLLSRKLTDQEWYEVLSLFKTHQILEIPGAIGNVEDQTPLYIYSTINIFCSAMDIHAMVEKYRDEADTMGSTEKAEEGELS